MMGHPFDTIKTRMQADSAYRSATSCASAMMRNEGVLSLWKGLSPAVAAGIMTGSIRFGVQSWANKALARSMGVDDFEHLGLQTRVASEAFGGFIAGLVLPILFTPLEMVKCRQQVNENAGGRPMGTFTILRNAIRAEGIRGIYIGHLMTTLRSTNGNAALFGSYVVAKDFLGLAFAPDSAYSALIRPLSGIFAGRL
jgi:hypothetical protein